MPYTIKRAPKGGWNIVRKDTGAVVGHSTNIAKAKASIGYRMAAEKNKKNAA